MNNEPIVAENVIAADITAALGTNANVVAALTPVVRMYYCNGWFSGFKAGQEDEISKQRGTHNGGTK